MIKLIIDYICLPNLYHSWPSLHKWSHGLEFFFSSQKVMSRNSSTFLIDLTIWNASMTWTKSPSNKIQHLVYEEKSAKGEIFEYFLLSSLQPHCRVQISIWEHFMNRRDLYFFNSFLAQTMVVGIAFGSCRSKVWYVSRSCF